MSLETVLEKTETAASGAAATPAASPTAQETPKEVQQPAVEQPKATPAEQPTSAATQPEIETEPDLEAVPEGSGDYEKFKKVFESHPDLKTELKQIIGREKAFSELAPNGSFSDVREILQRIPTVEDAETLTSQAENAKAFGEAFRGDRVSFVESLKESDPLAFQALATELPDILAQTDEKLYTEQARVYTNRVMSNTLAIAQQSGDAELLKAAQLVAQFLGVRPGDSPARPGADNSEAARLRKQLQERDEADASSAFNSFWSQTDEVIINSGIAEVERTLKQALPNATPKQMQRMVKETWDKTLENLNAQPQFRAQLDTYRASAKKGRVGIADHKAIVDFGTRRAKLVIPKVARDVISEWSKEVLQLSKETLDKKKDIAANTRDVGTGPQGTTSAAAPSNGNAKPRSMESIFQSIENRSYAKH